MNSKNTTGNVVNIGEYKRGFRELDQFTFHHTLESTPGQSIVILSKQGCNSCRAWKTLLLNFQKRHMKTELFEADLERDSALAAEFEVFHLPSIYLYIDGHFHCEIQCEANLDKLEHFIAEAVKQPPQEQP